MANLTVLLILCIVALTSAFHVSHSIRTPMKAINKDNIFHQDNRLMMVSHRMGFNRLSRPADQRKALLRALTTEVIRHGKKIYVSYGKQIEREKFQNMNSNNDSNYKYNSLMPKYCCFHLTLIII